MEQKIESIQIMARKVKKVYSLLAIQNHLYNAKVEFIEKKHISNDDIEDITEYFYDISHFFELIYEGDYKEAQTYLKVLDHNTGKEVWKYLASLYESVICRKEEETKKHFSIFELIKSEKFIRIASTVS